ncbi:unnamed protein product, partial [Mesorhabditis belari]|uniref:MADF domain-containing protein n=1 Tax=Mesorhabditis belari TaxID=2138241 RepID=A0AAF3FQR8_9BILA
MMRVAEEFNHRLNPASRVMIDAMKRTFIQMIAASLPIWSAYVNSEDRKFRDWAAITAKMNQFFPEWNFTVDQLKVQWKILRDSYKRERNRLLADKTRAVKWKFYKDLSFLEDSGMFVAPPPAGMDPSSESWITEQQKLATQALERSKTVAQTHSHFLNPDIPLEYLPDQDALSENSLELLKESTNSRGHDSSTADFPFHHLFESSNNASIPSPSRSLDEGTTSPLSSLFGQHFNNSFLNGEKTLNAFNINGKTEPLFNAKSIRKRNFEDSNRKETRMDKFELLGQMVTQTLRELSADDELQVEEAYIDIEASLHKLRKATLQRKQKREL